MKLWITGFVVLTGIWGMGGCDDRDPEPAPPTFLFSPSQLEAVGTEVTVTLKDSPTLLPGWKKAFEWWTVDEAIVCRGEECAITSASPATVKLVFHLKIYGEPQNGAIAEFAQATQEYEYEWNVPAIEFQ